jgi:hypothetical protein
MPDFMHQLRCRLLELGCPPKRMRHMVREVADHREDLLAAARTEGLGMPGAEARAEARLGNPQALAEELMASLRRSTWCGRHRLISFGLLPALLFPVLWLLVLIVSTLVWGEVYCGWDEKALHNAAANPVTYGHLLWVARGVDCVAIGLVFLLFCLLARLSAVGFKWLLIAGLICGAYSLFLGPFWTPHSFGIGFTWTPRWHRAAIPLLMLGAAHWQRRRLVRKALKTSDWNPELD